MSRYIDADTIEIILDGAIQGEEVTGNAPMINAHELMCMLHDIPAADVQEIKRGRWLVKDKGIIVTSYCCSECGRVVRDDTGYDVVIDYPYCHCGAKMVNEDE